MDTKKIIKIWDLLAGGLTAEIKTCSFPIIYFLFVLGFISCNQNFYKIKFSILKLDNNVLLDKFDQEAIFIECNPILNRFDPVPNTQIIINHKMKLNGVPKNSIPHLYYNQLRNYLLSNSKKFCNKEIYFLKKNIFKGKYYFNPTSFNDEMFFYSNDLIAIFSFDQNCEIRGGNLYNGGEDSQVHILE